jgi:amidase
MDIDAYDACDATALAALIAAGEVTPHEALDRALERAGTLNPALGAVVALAEDAARAAIDAGLPEGPFRGVPFVLKDLGTAAVGLPGRDGTRLLGAQTYAYDDEIVARMRATGLSMFGRTASPEGGIGVVTEAAVYGAPTRNPWDLGRTAGGSSGGSASAVAAGIVPAAHGSDGGGSVRIPASSCGLVGFKPTRARLPDGPDAGEGWAGMATDGVLTRSVRDTATWLDACCGPDMGQPYTAPPLRAGFIASMARPPRALRIAVCPGTFDGAAIHPDCSAGVEATADLLSDLGHHVEVARPAANQRAMMKAWTDIVACGTWKWVRAAARAQGLPNDGLDVIETVARGACLHAKTLDGADYLSAVSVIHAFGRDMAKMFQTHDVLLSATLAEPPAQIGRFAHSRPEFEDYVAYRTGPGGCFDYSPFTAVFNASGQPAMSLPLHRTAANLPIGIHFAAAYGDDETLIALAAQLETARPWFHLRPEMTGVPHKS